MEERERLMYSKWKARVLKDRLLLVYPTWFDQLEIINDEISSDNKFISMMRLMQAFENKKIICHPVKMIDNLITMTDVKLQDLTVSFKINDNQEEVIAAKQGVYIETNHEAVLAAAIVSDVIVISTKCERKEVLNRTNKVSDSLQIVKVDCVDERKQIITKEILPHRVRDDIFNFCCDNEKFTNDCFNKIMGSRYLDYNVFDKEISTVRDFNKYYDDSCKYRGGDDGLGMLSFGYLMGDMSRSLVKNISAFLDLRQLLDDYSVKVIYLKGALMNNYVIQILVRNFYFVVIKGYNGDNLTHHEIDNNLYGVYGDIDSEISYGVYYNVISKDLTNKHPFQIFEVFPNKKSDIIFYATKIQLNDKMNVQSSMQYWYGLLPVALPHDGKVLCVYPPIYNFRFKELLNRAVKSNYTRNNFHVRRMMWANSDPFWYKVKYFDRIILPQRNKTYENLYIESNCPKDIDIPMSAGMVWRQKKKKRKSS